MSPWNSGVATTLTTCWNPGQGPSRHARAELIRAPYNSPDHAAPAQFAPLHLSSKLVSVLSSMRHPILIVIAVILWLIGAARSTAIEYFVAGLTASGFYLAASSFSPGGRDIDRAESSTGASSVTTRDNEERDAHRTLITALA